MDGFALRSADAQVGATLRVIGEVAAGVAPATRVEPGTAVRILTGAPLPPGADAVVPVEDTDAPPGVAELPAHVAIHAAFEAGAHIRRAGSDLRAGQPLLEPGTQLTPASLAVVGRGRPRRVLAVHRRPRVAILATGDELVAGRRRPRRRTDPRQQHARSDGRSARCRRGSSLVGHRARQLRIGAVTRSSVASSGRTSSSPAAACQSVPTTSSRTPSPPSARSTCGASPSSRASRSRSVAAPGRRTCCCSGCPAIR